MRVLWLTNTPGGASKYLNYNFNGGGWISSLESYIKDIDEITLAVSFFFDQTDEVKFSHDHVTYYPIKTKASTFKGKLKARLLNQLVDSNIAALLNVINDFKPDLIQLFGTESGLGEVVMHTKIPVIVHIQGLINPYLGVWLPKGISINNIFFKTPIIDIILRRGVIDSYNLLRKKAQREELIIRNSYYFFGRTSWDKKIIKIYNRKFEYIHCDEILRPSFYDQYWQLKELTPNSNLKLVSVINPNIYKGIEIVLEAAAILKQITNTKFQWSIFGMAEDNGLITLIESSKHMSFDANNVAFTGARTSDELVLELLDAHIFIHPSHIENSPNSVCEAMLLGLPVIAGNVGGLPSIIENNVNGILYNSSDAFELVATIIELAGNGSEMKRLGINARETALKRHGFHDIVSKVVETYNYIIQQPKVNNLQIPFNF